MRGFQCFAVLVLFISINLGFSSHSMGKSVLDSLMYGYETGLSDSLRSRYAIGIAEYYATSDFALSFHYADEALKFADRSKSKKLKAQTLNALGTIYFYQGLLDISISHYHQAMDIYSEAKEGIGVVNSLINLGGVLLQLQKFDDAQVYFHDALTQLSAISSTDDGAIPSHQAITLYNNLGIVHENLGEYNQAIDYYRRGIWLAKESNDSMRYLGNLYNNLGSCHIKKKEYAEALQSINSAMLIRKELKDQLGFASSYRMLGILYKLKGDTEEALKNFYIGYGLATSEGSLAILQSISEQLYEIYYDSHKPDSALKYHLQLKEYSDRMKSEEILRDFTRLELQAKYKAEQERLEFQQRKHSMRSLYFGIILLLLLIISGLFFFLSQSRLRRTRLMNANMQLELEKNALEMETIEHDLEIKNKELTTSVIYQIQRNELLTEVAEKLMSFSRNFKQEDRKLISDIVKDLLSVKQDSIWEEFEARFHQVHNSFYQNLNKVHPDLSPNERRLCAFLRLNMSTKEISSITGQSIRSIEVARTRLRKKLDLTNSEIGLIEYLSSI